MNDQQELNEHLTVQPLDYVEQADDYCIACDSRGSNTEFTDNLGDIKHTCKSCGFKWYIFSPSTSTVHPGNGFGTDYPHPPKPQLTIPWPAIMFIAGLAFGFIFGVMK